MSEGAATDSSLSVPHASILAPRPGTVLALVSVAHGITHVYAALFPLIYPIIQREWGLSYGLLGGMIGFVSFVGGLLQLIFGVAGRYAPRNVVLGLGNVLFGISTGLTALTTNFAGFTALRCLGAVANAPQHPVGNSMIADSFPRARRGSALSVNFAGGNIGTLVVPLVAVALIGSMGWQATMWVFAIPGIVVGLMLMFLLDDPRRSEPRSELRNISLWSQVREIHQNRTVMMLIGASSIAGAGRGLGVLLTFIPLYLTNDQHYSPTAVGIFYTIMLVGTVLGPVAAGQLSDRYGRKTILMATYGLSFLVTAAFALSGNPVAPVLGIVLFLMGAFVFCESPLIQSYMADSVEAGKRDVLFGFYFAWTYAMGALWVPLVGTLIDRIGFSATWLLIAVSYLGGALMVQQSRENTIVPGPASSAT